MKYKNVKEKNSMNILVISPQLYPCITGGVEIFNYYLIKELARREHKVWILTTCEHDWDNRNISLVKLNKRFLLHSTLMIDSHILFKLIKLRKQIDVVHVPYTSNSHLAYPLLLAKKLFDIPYIITIHGGGMHPWKPKIPHKLFFKHADAIVAVSETIKEEYEKRSGRKIKVIPPLIPFRESKTPKDKLRSKYGFNNADTIILSLGSIKKIKGNDILLNAFLKLEKEYIKRHNLKLLYVGDGPMKPALERIVNDRSFNQYVKFFGNVPYEKVSETYKLADIYTIPSFFEGTPVALLEAMFNALPIIGTNVNGINSLIRHKKNGLLFEKENVEDLKEKIKKLVEDKDLSNRLGNTAKNGYFKSYNFECVVSEHIKLCKNIVEGNYD